MPRGQNFMRSEEPPRAHESSRNRRNTKNKGATEESPPRQPIFWLN
jgi:hypothetical protein